MDQDFGLLQAVDERLACYGWLTNTAVKFVIVVDMEGRPAGAEGAAEGKGRAATIVGLRDADMKPVSIFHVWTGPFLTRFGYEDDHLYNLTRDSFQAFKALQTAYVHLCHNPFYDPDEHTPITPSGEYRVGGTQITSRNFINEVRRIGEAWAPGIANI